MINPVSAALLNLWLKLLQHDAWMWTRTPVLGHVLSWECRRSDRWSRRQRPFGTQTSHKAVSRMLNKHSLLTLSTDNCRRLVILKPIGTISAEAEDLQRLSETGQREASILDRKETSCSWFSFGFIDRTKINLTLLLIPLLSSGFLLVPRIL